MVDPKFVINLKGKDFVLLAGLLDVAHQNGLIGIETEVCEKFSNPEKDFWVVKATGRFRAPEGDAIWTAYGDASPISSQMKGAYLRHAETRSIARMARFATNIGMTAFEECDFRNQEHEDEEPIKPRQYPIATPRTINQRPPAQVEPQRAGGDEHLPAVEPSRDATSPAVRTPAAQPDGPAPCSVCGKECTRGQVAVSWRSYGQVFCPSHQREQNLARKTDIVAKSIEMQSPNAAAAAASN